MKQPYSALRATKDDIERFINDKEVAPLLAAGWELWFAHGDSTEFDDGEVLFRHPTGSITLMPLDKTIAMQSLIERAQT